MDELHRARKIEIVFNLETKWTISRYISAGFPQKFINDVIKTFREEKEVSIILEWLFEERNTVSSSLTLQKIVKKLWKAL